jgi:hypothetical protein
MQHSTVYSCGNPKLHLGLLAFWTLSIARYAKEHKRTGRFGNCIHFRHQMSEWEAPTLLRPLETADLNY